MLSSYGSITISNLVGKTRFSCTNSLAVCFPIFLAISASVFARLAVSTLGSTFVSTFLEGFFWRVLTVLWRENGVHGFVFLEFWTSEVFGVDPFPLVTRLSQSSPRIHNPHFACWFTLFKVKTNIHILGFQLGFTDSTDSLVPGICFTY